MSELAQALRTILDVRLFEVAGTTVTVASVATFVVIVALTFWVSRVVQKFVGQGLTRGGLTEQATIHLVQRALHYLVLVAGVAVALQTIGISLATAFAAGAVVAVGVGFALQNILQNFVSGVILLAERSIKEMDVLEVNGRTIRVEKIGTRATVARSRDESQLIIPNAELVQSVVTNYTFQDSLHRVGTEIGVSYGSDMNTVRRVLEETARALPDRHTEIDPFVFLKEFADSSVVWGVLVWSVDPWRAPALKFQLNERLWWALKEAGVQIPFPQVDVHFPGGTPAGS